MRHGGLMRTATFILSCFIVAATISGVADGQTTASAGPARTANSEIIESGKFRFYETKQIRGEETYEITRTANGELLLTAKTDMPFAEQEKKPLVNVTLRTTTDFTPQTFQIKGPTLLDLEENASVVIEGSVARVQDGGRDSTAKVPKNFFVMSGYVPVTVEMMLVRYWLTHGQPKSIQLLPIGEAFVELRGKDTVTIAGKSIVLSRYHLSGKNWRGGWGRQTLWLDDQNRLVAAVNLGSDIETNLYAFRDGFESQTSFFLKRAVDDAIDRLTELANQLSPQTTVPVALVGGTLIDVNGKPATPDSVVVIQGDRIIAAGPRASVKIPNNAKVINV